MFTATVLLHLHRDFYLKAQKQIKDLILLESMNNYSTKDETTRKILTSSVSLTWRTQITISGLQTRIGAHNRRTYSQNAHTKLSNN